MTSPSYTGAVPPPAVGTGPNAAAISFKNFWEFMDRLAIHAGMTQACLTKRIDKQREPGVFHGVRQHIAAEFENEIDNYGWGAVGWKALHGPANGCCIGHSCPEMIRAFPIDGDGSNHSDSCRPADIILYLSNVAQPHCPVLAIIYTHFLFVFVSTCYLHHHCVCLDSYTLYHIASYYLSSRKCGV